MTTRDELDAFRAAQRALWGSAGDYAAIAPYLEPVADVLVERLVPTPGAEMLDVAAGTGNAALALARAGARVSALDLTPALLEQGRSRAAAEGLDIAWVDGGAEALPFAAVGLRRCGLGVRGDVRPAPCGGRRGARAGLPTGRSHRAGRVDA